MNQTRKLGVVNGNKTAKVHAIYIHTLHDTAYKTLCTDQRIYRLINLDPSESDRLCQRCFKRLPLPWKDEA